MLKDTQRFQVAVRCRPLSHYETQLESKTVIEISNTQQDIILKNSKLSDADDSKTFKFDHLYGPESAQEQIYKELASPIVRSVIGGQNATILVYGKTAVGKTYTMLGKQEPAEQRGIIPRACEEIFEYLKEIPSEQASVTVSHCEVHQEEVNDLLTSKKSLGLKEQADKTICVKDLSSFTVNSMDEIEHLYKNSQKNMSLPVTRMNLASYSGHAVFTIAVQTSYVGEDQNVHERKGKLTLVDLAGSERFISGGCTSGPLQKEIIKTNHSLATFDHVIAALAKSTFVPYRDSKLTRLLQSSLNGSEKTLIIANVSPSDSCYGESLATLKVAEQAKTVKN